MKERHPISESDFANRVTPAVRLFLSVDLENSTKLKHTSGSRGEEWLTAVLLFAKSFPQLLDAQLQERCRRSGHPMLNVPPVWKMLGDELIFVTVIDKAIQVAAYMEAFQQALLVWNQDVAKGMSRGRLRVKGAAWLAGFPIVNAVFDTGDGLVDYAGPSLDAGFRISKLATPRRLAVSVDLAWLLLKANFNGLLRFDGPTMLKGLAEESGYPFLWIEVGMSKYLKAERQLLGYGGQNDKETMLALCEHFICEFGVPSHVPFLANDPDYATKPSNYDEDLRLRIEFLRQNIYVVDEPENSGATPTRSDITQDSLLRQLGELEDKQST